MSATINITGQPPIKLNSSRYLIGRGDGCEILLPEDDASASRRHALLERNDRAEWTVVDLGSRNGILVNGNRISDRVTLHDGDCITVGKTSLTLALPRTQPTIQTEAPVFMQAKEPVVAPSVASILSASVREAQAPPPAVAVQPIWASIPTASDPPSPSSFQASAAESVRRDTVAESAPSFASGGSSPAERPLRDVSRHAPESSTPLYPMAPVSTPATAEYNRTPVIAGGIMLAVGLIAYFCWAQPGIDACQSGVGQLSIIIGAIGGNQGAAQQCQTFMIGRIACALISIAGGGLLGFALFRRR